MTSSCQSSSCDSFSDGTMIVADADHQWPTESGIRTTAELRCGGDRLIPATLPARVGGTTALLALGVHVAWVRKVESVPVDSAPSLALSSTDASVPLDEVAAARIASGQIVLRPMFAQKTSAIGVLPIPAKDIEQPTTCKMQRPKA